MPFTTTVTSFRFSYVSCSAFAFASTASVGDGDTLRAQVESCAGGLLIDKRENERVAFMEKQAPVTLAAV